MNLDIIMRYQSVLPQIQAEIEQNQFNGYEDLFKILIKHLNNDGTPFVEHAIKSIHSGGYSGTILFVVPKDEYESEFWMCYIRYGSCCVCDTYEEIMSGTSKGETLNDTQIKDLMMLILHMAQRLQLIDVSTLLMTKENN